MTNCDGQWDTVASWLHCIDHAHSSLTLTLTSSWPMQEPLSLCLV